MEKFAKALIDAGTTTVVTLLVRHYRELGMTNDDFLVYLQLKSFADQGEVFPETKLLAKALDWPEQRVFEVLHQMIEKKLMHIQPGQKNGSTNSDAYDFSLLFEKLAQLQTVDESVAVDKNDGLKSNGRQSVFQQIEQEFGRPLSPIELETISQWLDTDHYAPELIQLALKEAVLSQVYNLKYMDRILLAWERKNLKTPAQVQQDKSRRDSNKGTVTGKKVNSTDVPDIPLFNIGDQPSKP